MLTVRQVTKTYSNSVRALDAVSLDAPGGMFGLLGPNGAGKSTLMRIIATLQEPDSGSVEFDGIDVGREPMRLRQQLGYLPQEFGLYPEVSAEHLLHHFAALKGIRSRVERKTTVDHLLRLTNLDAYRRRKLGTFSGGMKQRFGIAQALVGRPRLIIVDEPTAGLDPEERNRFHNILSEISAEVVVLLSTHIVDDVRQLCPRLAILREGELVYQGLTNDALDMAAGRVWRCCLPRAASPEALDHHLVLRSRRAAGDTVVHVWSASCPGDRFVSVVPELEDVYFALVRGYLPAGRAD